MPNLRLTDDFGLDLLLRPDPISAFVRYFLVPPTMRAVHSDLKSLIETPLASIPPGSGSIGLLFDRAYKLGMGGPELTVAAGAHGTLSVITKGQLFENDACESAVAVGTNEAYVGFAIAAGLAVEPGDQLGELGFGFQAGTEITLTHYRRFGTTPAEPSLRSALADTLTHYTIPADVGDLLVMPVGTIFTIQGSGKITFSATVDLLTAANPLATLSAKIVPLALPINAAGEISVAASYQLSGNYQMRVRKLDADHIELGFCRAQGSTFDVDVSADAGVSSPVGKSDLIAAVVGAISPNPTADLAGLKLDDAKADLIASALQKAVERKLQLALKAQLEFLSSREEAFLFEIDLRALDSAGRRAVHDALHSKLAAVVGDAPMLPPGIRWKKSVLARARERGVSLRLNLLGLYNYLSLSDLLVSSSIGTDLESGEVIITDQATATRIGLAANFLSEDVRSKLRSVLAESFLLTAVYRCSGAIAEAPQLSGSYWFLDLHSATARRDIEDHLNVVVALGITLAGDAIPPAGVSNFGRSVFYVDTEYDAGAVRAIFLNANGAPRTYAEFEAIGRGAMRAVLLAGAVNEDRRTALDDGHWPEVVRAAGNRKILGDIFPTAPEPVLMDIYGDWFVIVNWSQAMAEAAACLARAYPYFSQIPSPDPQSQEFASRRTELQHQLASVAKETRDRFAEPWGLIAMDLASGRTSKVSAGLYSDRLTWVLVRPVNTSAP